VRRAAAVKYHDDVPAPFIVAKGSGKLAEVIERIAREKNVPIEINPDLAHALVELSPGSFIPEEFYEIMAQILIFIRNLREGDE
jgi:flagellar biosynthesis protein